MWYKVLKVNETASEEEIKVAYDKLMKNPSIANDMEKSFKVRDAYKQGLAYANTNDSSPSTTINNVTSSKKSKPSKKTKSSAKQSDSMSLYGKIQLIFVLTFVIAIIVVAVVKSIQESLYDDEDVVYDSEILNCIATKTEMDTEEFESEIYTNGYTLEYTYLHTKVFVKEKEDYKFFLEVENSYDNTSCTIKLVEEFDVEWKEKPAKLIGEYTVSGLYKHGNQLGDYDVNYSVFKEDPFYETEKILFDNYDEIEDDIEDFEPAEYMMEEYPDYISKEIILDYFDILKSELESFED